MTESDSISLVVLSHGLWGNKGHMNYIKNQLIQRYKNSIYVLNMDINESKFTYDGIDVCGERAAIQIQKTIKRLNNANKKVVKISMIGYSLGGLILRYAIGVLGEKGVFEDVIPDYFITFATPHMGVRLPDKGFFSKIFNFTTSKFISRSGEQLQLRDKFGKKEKPLIQTLSDPDDIYFKHLARFNTRRSYANIANDRTVPYWTSGIELMDYFHENKGKLDITLDETYISIVTAFDLKTRSKDTLSKEDTAKSKKTKKRIKPILFRCAFYILSPILVPVFLVIAFTTISIQGLISRFRVSKLLKFQQRPLINQAESDNHSSSNDELIESNLLTDALDVINIPGEETPDISKDTHSHTLDDRTHYYEVSPSPALKEISKQLNLDESICTTYKNLRLLEWERVWVYLSAFNAHGAIICRQSIHTTEDGIATIQHFLDTTQFSV